MKRIGLLSDTHGELPLKTREFFSDCDEIWHAGDAGSLSILEELKLYRPLRAVHGNIDGMAVRSLYPANQLFMCEGVKVFMTHIGGYPGKYDPAARKIIETEKPALFISGHSHILKVIPDKKHGLLHLNPGAAGNQGLHQKITMMRFIIDGAEIKELDIYEKTRR
jgi:putative phosphoesterase